MDCIILKCLCQVFWLEQIGVDMKVGKTVENHAYLYSEFHIVLEYGWMMWFTKNLDCFCWAIF